MKNLNHPIEEKADLAQLGLIKLEVFHSDELDTLIGHLNLKIKELILNDPIMYPYYGNFEYQITYRKYSEIPGQDIKTDQLILEFYYRYKGNIILPIKFDIHTLYQMYDGWIGSNILTFNYDCYTILVESDFDSILKGNRIISDNPNHFFYNLTYRDITKMKNVIQTEIKYES
jgi:hypothetical protein